MPEITIKIGAARDEVVVDHGADGTFSFDRTQMSRDEKRLLTTKLVEALLRTGKVKRRKRSELREAAASA